MHSSSYSCNYCNRYNQCDRLSCHYQQYHYNNDTISTYIIPRRLSGSTGKWARTPGWGSTRSPAPPSLITNAPSSTSGTRFGLGYGRTLIIHRALPTNTSKPLSTVGIPTTSNEIEAIDQLGRKPLLSTKSWIQYSHFSILDERHRELALHVELEKSDVTLLKVSLAEIVDGMVTSVFYTIVSRTGLVIPFLRLLTLDPCIRRY